MLRGTIAELIPKKRVVIVLLTGEKRTIAMTEVDYAGPASGAPGAAPPAPAEPQVAPEATPSPEGSDEGEESPEAPKKKKKRRVSEIEAALTGEEEAAPGEKEKPRKPTHAMESESQVTFDSKEPGLRVYVQTATATATVGWNTVSIDAYTPLCTTPCTTSLAPGSYRVAVGTASGKPVPVEDPIVVGSGDSVKVEYQSNTGMRAAGWVILIVGTLAGTALMLTATSTEPCTPSTTTFSTTCIPQTTTNTDQVLMGGVVAGGSALVGLILILQKDHASAEVGAGPMAFRLTPTRGEAPRGIAEALAPGFGFSGTF
jgi:hypothetical protein